MTLLDNIPARFTRPYPFDQPEGLTPKDGLENRA
jgi:hypothetical protein